MKKLRLDLDVLVVESFNTGAGDGGGTVLGRSQGTWEYDCTAMGCQDTEFCLQDPTYPNNATCGYGCSQDPGVPGCRNTMTQQPSCWRTCQGDTCAATCEVGGYCQVCTLRVSYCDYPPM